MTVLMMLLAAVPVAAQEPGNNLLQDLLQAARLPTVTQEARGLGVPERDLQTIFATAHGLRIPPGSLVDLINEENQAIREHGRIDNFGAFVQQKLNEGLRGRDLAAAIHAYAARGWVRAGRRSGSFQGAIGGKPEPGKSGESGKKEEAMPLAGFARWLFPPWRQGWSCSRSAAPDTLYEKSATPVKSVRQR
jgi:hypothetical protein